jgi:MFS family permease
MKYVADIEIKIRPTTSSTFSVRSQPIWYAKLSLTTPTDMANLSGEINLIASGVQYALFIIFSSIMFFFVDKIGRRTLLVWGAIAMAFCHFVVGGILGFHYTYVPGQSLSDVTLYAH